MFREEILDTKKDTQTEADMYPTTLPYYSGRAQMLKMKKHRLIQLKKVCKTFWLELMLSKLISLQMFDDAGWMLTCSISKDVFAQYEKLIHSIDSKIINLYRKWIDSIGEDVGSRLQRPLMAKSIAKPGLLECNIDRYVTQL